LISLKNFVFYGRFLASDPQWISSSNLPSKGTNHFLASKSLSRFSNGLPSLTLHDTASSEGGGHVFIASTAIAVVAVVQDQLLPLHNSSATARGSGSSIVFLANQVVITVKHAEQCIFSFVGLSKTVVVLLVEGKTARITGLDIAEENFHLWASVPQWISSSNLPSKAFNH
jgi:hypothetical protein